MSNEDWRIRAAGDGPLVIEEFLDGEEASLFALIDGVGAVQAVPEPASALLLALQ